MLILCLHSEWTCFEDGFEEYARLLPVDRPEMWCSLLEQVGVILPILAHWVTNQVEFDKMLQFAYRTDRTDVVVLDLQFSKVC